MRTVLLSDSNTATVWTGERRHLDALDLLQDVSLAVYGVINDDFAVVTLVIQV